MRRERTIPAWARALDIFAIGFILAGLSVLTTGGFREWTPLGRVSVTSWVRPFSIGAVCVLVRHGFYRQPSLAALVVSFLRGWRDSTEWRIVWPVFFSDSSEEFMGEIGLRQLAK